ncbi:hypothetical protein K449DRAFT_36342 [Hypoxylon sp. EC38]|nr:hypothetical protein K449DRAFT_36342 [Hypoxylon sp. EC38]
MTDPGYLLYVCICLHVFYFKYKPREMSTFALDPSLFAKEVCCSHPFCQGSIIRNC